MINKAYFEVLPTPKSNQTTGNILLPVYLPSNFFLFSSGGRSVKDSRCQYQRNPNNFRCTYCGAGACEISRFPDQPLLSRFPGCFPPWNEPVVVPTPPLSIRSDLFRVRVDQSNSRCSFEMRQACDSKGGKRALIMGSSNQSLEREIVQRKISEFSKSHASCSVIHR